MNFVEQIGAALVARTRMLQKLSAVLWCVLTLAVRSRHWSRTVRNVLARQVLFTGVEALGLVFWLALLTGVSVVAQAQIWLQRFGQSGMLGSVLVAVIISEFGPLLVNFVVIGRSGTAIATELASMQVRGEIDVLEALGLDTMAYLAMPRVLGAAISVFSLAILFVAVSLGSGYIFGLLLGGTPGTPANFAANVMQAMSPATVANFLAKTIVPGLLTGAICSLQGLEVEGAVTEVPQAGTRAVVGSMVALAVVSAVTSVLTYA
ncbi:MAG: ABC transporter permease [Kiritimatiellia bacterium]